MDNDLEIYFKELLVSSCIFGKEISNEDKIIFALTDFSDLDLLDMFNAITCDTITLNRIDKFIELTARVGKDIIFNNRPDILRHCDKEIVMDIISRLEDVGDKTRIATLINYVPNYLKMKAILKFEEYIRHLIIKDNTYILSFDESYRILIFKHFKPELSDAVKRNPKFCQFVRENEYAEIIELYKEEILFAKDNRICTIIYGTNAFNKLIMDLYRRNEK